MFPNWPRLHKPSKLRAKSGSIWKDSNVPRSTDSGSRMKGNKTGRDKIGTPRFWLYGVHPVREALGNPNRRKYRLVVTQNALNRLGECVSSSGLVPEVVSPRNFPVRFETGTSHQGCALLADPLPRRKLDWHLFEKQQDQPLLAVFSRPGYRPHEHWCHLANREHIWRRRGCRPCATLGKRVGCAGKGGVRRARQSPLSSRAEPRKFNDLRLGHRNNHHRPRRVGDH